MHSRTSESYYANFTCTNQGFNCTHPYELTISTTYTGLQTKLNVAFTEVDFFVPFIQIFFS